MMLIDDNKLTRETIHMLGKDLQIEKRSDEDEDDYSYRVLVECDLCRYSDEELVELYGYLLKHEGEYFDIETEYAKKIFEKAILYDAVVAKWSDWGMI